MDSGASHLFVLLLVSSIADIRSEPILRLPSENDAVSTDYCDGWRLVVETNKVGAGKRVPRNCVAFVAEFVAGGRYRMDSEVVGDLATAFAKSVELDGNGRDAWVFDIDETLLSNVPYYQAIGFGSEVFNETSFDNWVNLLQPQLWNPV